ncbi:hypothetical protein HB852_12550 [Listeria grandensis]|uniref:Uncharacterized protein n=1 Tax=Listeria grandensis TaxID=1494963 RepID=A0A7X0Y4B2_9LIST|nr:hypothetical protein [Listeria grandensis]MBC1475443.1 hypothetical protein [Listeria grandensis]MBC1936674.1 hypothetical protein [Listeria grandensis]
MKNSRISRFIIGLLACIAIGGAAFLIFWNVQAEEVMPEIDQAKLMDSNRTWIKTSTSIAIEPNLVVPIKGDNTVTSIANNGDLILDTTNKTVLTKMAKVDSKYREMDRFRIRIFANKVSTVMNPATFQYTHDKVDGFLTSYSILNGTLEKVAGKGFNLTTTVGTPLQVNEKLETEYSSRLAEKIAPVLGINAKISSQYLEDEFNIEAGEQVIAYPRQLHYQFSAEKTSLVFFKGDSDEEIEQPVGLEYVIKK